MGLKTNAILFMFYSFVLILFGFATYNIFFLEEKAVENNCMTSYKVSRLSNVYSAIIYDASRFGEVKNNTQEMINNYKIEFGEDIPPITVSVVGGS
jgi:hypothetical protein